MYVQARVIKLIVPLGGDSGGELCDWDTQDQSDQLYITGGLGTHENLIQAVESVV